MEQLCITNNTILECEEYLKNHGGHSKRKFEEALKKNGCDRQTYFDAQMVGNMRSMVKSYTVTCLMSLIQSSYIKI